MNAAPSDADEARTHPAVRAVLDSFGARVLAVERAAGVPAAEEPGPGAAP